MELPQFAFATNNPVSINLLHNMSIMKQLYVKFLSIHAQVFASKHPNSGITFFSAQAQIQKHPNSIAFVTGFMGIMSIVDEIDLTNQQSVLQHKLKIFQLVTNCESQFFTFNQHFPPTPELIYLIYQISAVFTAVKQGLKQLGLYDMPSCDLNQAAPTPNPAAAQVHDRVDSAESDEDRRAHKGRRMQ